MSIESRLWGLVLVHGDDWIGVYDPMGRLIHQDHRDNTLEWLLRELGVTFLHQDDVVFPYLEEHGAFPADLYEIGLEL